MVEEAALNEAYIVIGGPQGSGLETSAQVLTVVFASHGYGVIANREYHSNIIGRHSYVAMTVNSVKTPHYFNYPFHAAAFMDAESVFVHYGGVGEGSILVYDKGLDNVNIDSVISMRSDTKERLLREYRKQGIDPTVRGVVKYLASSRGVQVVGLDYKNILSILREKFSVPPALARRYVSSIIVGAVVGSFGIASEDVIREGFKYRFRGREKVVESNTYIASLVAKEVMSKVKTFKLQEGKAIDDFSFVVSGNDAVAIGKVVGGVRFQSYYPITPAQDECFYLEGHMRIRTSRGDLGSVVVFQTEDEIAAIGASIGAALTGARAATATSGPGFDLMVESISWAYEAEVPIVITLYQRCGPSTGMPTRGSQEDLFAALFSGHGSTPRIVLASGDHEEAFYDAIKAQNLADKYQLPVVHLLDKFIANAIVTLQPPDLSSVVIERGKIVTSYDKPEPYKRFSLSDSPISEFVPLGVENAVSWHTGLEHNEYGLVSEDPETRMKMVEKRVSKFLLAGKEIPEEGERAVLLPEGIDASDVELLMVGWGSVKGAAVEAAKKLREQGIKAAYLHIRYFAPFPSEYVSSVINKVIKAGGLVVDVEHNELGQAAQVVEMNTGIVVDKFILKYTGRPIYLNELIEAAKKIMKEKIDKVVLKYGA